MQFKEFLSQKSQMRRIIKYEVEMSRDLPNSTDEITDEHLMDSVQSGNWAAFEVLYERHSGRVLGYLQKKVDSQTALDLMQETFVKVFRHHRRYNSQYPFLPWLFTLSRHVLLDHLKSRQFQNKQLSVSQELIPEVAWQPQRDGIPDFSEALRSLSPTQKRAVELRYLQEWSFEKIAQDLKTTEGNVRQILSRSVRALRKFLVKDGGEK